MADTFAAVPSRREHLTHDVRRRVLEVLRDTATRPLVEEYFRTDSAGQPLFTGSWFERVGGGGTPPEVRHGFTADDLVAVQMLSVTVPAEAAVWMLGRGAKELASLLEQIPVGVTPRDGQGAEMLRLDGGPLTQMWRLLHGQRGIGWVTAGKLCARKRPALAPVYDRHIRDTVGGPQRWWAEVADLFADAETLGLLAAHQAAARDAGGDVTLLRALDIALWMRQWGYQWARPAVRPAGGAMKL